MNNQISSRSPQLGPLSKEHKDGLEFVDRLRYGLCHTSLDRVRSYACWYWKNHIRPHFFQEEKILLPYLPADHRLAKKMKDDHEYIRDLVITLDHDCNPQSIKALADLLVSHIRFEEIQVFNYLEETLSEDDLNNINLALRDHPVAEGEWTDRFWAE
jgi:hemerythrin-like domain-containing protein